MAEHPLAPTTDALVPAGACEEPAPAKEKKKKKKKVHLPKKVYESGGVVVADGKVALRLTDEQNWIFPKGKLKKGESPQEAALREVIEETGLLVEILGDAGGFFMKVEGKTRRFAFYLMRATGRNWDWSHHDGRDTFLLEPSSVDAMIHKKGYGELWVAVRDRVIALCRETSDE